MSYQLHDLIEQPDFNPATQNNRGDWSLRDVSAGAVFLAADRKPACQDHGGGCGCQEFRLGVGCG